MTDTNFAVLYDVGDSLQNAVVANITQTDFDFDKILYALADTIVDSVLYEVFVYSQNPMDTVFDVNFSYVGTNQGDYIVSEQTVNGRIYKWIAPENGIPQGDYSPEYKLVAPEKHSVYEFGYNFYKNKNYIGLNFALSNKDYNLLSPFDDDDNIGFATNLNIKHFVTGSDSSVTKSGFYSDFELVAKQFVPIRTFRSQEFDRDWAIDTLLYNNVSSFSVGWFSERNNAAEKILLKSLFIGKDYLGVRPQVVFFRSQSRFNYTLNSAFLVSQIADKITNFAQTNFDVNYNLGILKLGLIYSQETNTSKNSLKNLLPLSFMYHSAGIYFENSDTSIFYCKMNYLRRYDFLPLQNNLSLSDFSDNYTISLSYVLQYFNSQLFVSYRNLQVKDTNLTQQTPINSLTSAFSMNWEVFHNTFNFHTNAQLSSGLEQKMQYVFIEVEPSKGIYTWNDYNNDGIKQLDEFEIASFSDEANYSRIAIQTNQYVKVFTKKINFSLMFYPAHLFAKQTNMSDFAKRFSNTFSFNIVHKGDNFDLIDFYDSSAIRFNSSINNLLTFRINKFLRFNYIYRKNKSNLLIISGLDVLKAETHKFVFKTKIIKNLSMIEEFELFDNLSLSDYSIIKNYNIIGNKNTLSAVYQFDNSQISLHYSYSQKINKRGIESLFCNEFGVSANFMFIKNMNILSEVNLVNNNFLGAVNENIAYLMMNGLKPDFNVTWNITTKKRLSKVLQISFIYSGRYNLSTKFIHSGNVNITAFM